MDYKEYENQESSQNFIMVGEVYDTKEDSAQTQSADGTASYANTTASETTAYYDPAVFQQTEAKQKKKKEPKYITKKAFVLSMIFCMILTYVQCVGVFISQSLRIHNFVINLK